MNKLNHYFVLLIFSAVILATGCTAPDVYAQKRRDKLLAKYHPGTSRADVMQSWDLLPPEVSELRPRAGWEKSNKPALSRQCQLSEKRTGKKIFRCDCYSTADGLFAMCNCWFFYDQSDKLLDVEWERIKE